MLNFFLKTTVLIIFTSCNNQAAKTNLSDTSLNAEISKESTIKNETITAIVKPIATFQYFEDYASLRSREALYAAFDSSALKDAVSWYAEGTVKVNVTYLHNSKNNHRIKFCWKNSAGEKLDFIEADYFQYNDEHEITTGEELKSKTGLRLGMPLTELVAWNGKEIKFWGFSWDYEGGILTGPGDMLSEIPITVKLSLDYSSSTKAYNSLMGDIELSSADSEVKKAPIVIDRFTFNL